jgi:hypothetical protein
VSVKLNPAAFRHAKKLVRDGKVVRDERDDWSEHAPGADDENRAVEKHGFAEFARWHLGLDEEKGEETKSRVGFPYGDFTKVHRCAVISLESRAAQYGHDDIAKAAGELLELIDEER